VMDPTRSREMPSCSAIDLTEIWRSSKIISLSWSIISGVVGLRTYQHSGKVPLLWTDSNETLIFSIYFRNVLRYQISLKSVQWEPSCPMRTDGRVDPTRSHDVPSCSAIDLTEIRRSSKISTWIWSIISGVVGLRTYQQPCKVPLLWSDSIEFSRSIFGKYLGIKFHENPFSGSPVVPCGRTDGQSWQSQ
jgi:hypothetical protein